MEARGSFSSNPVSHFEQIAYLLHGGIAILKHCAIRRSSTGLPPLAEITHSQYHGRSNAVEDKHGVACHRLFNKHVLLDETYPLCRVKERAADRDRAPLQLCSAA
jgi:hypothetical protein